MTAGRARQWPFAFDRLQQPLLLRAEAVELQLPLLRPQLALQRVARVQDLGSERRPLMPQQKLLLEMAMCEVLSLHPLPEVELVEPVHFGRGEPLSPCQTLLKVERQRVAMLLEMKAALLGGRVERMGGRRCREGQE